jgi:tRNA-Thr(GGU) m(6)t(6)A37 methyltransferase TsaA
MDITPIGHFHCLEKYPYDVPRQGSLAGDNLGLVRLDAQYAAGLRDLSGFSHIWLLFCFHLNQTWRPLVTPPRHRTRKVGVFASRSPYRPNPLGLSCVRLLEVRDTELLVSGHDLLDGTPILDIKPYLPYADSFPDASPGWTDDDRDAEDSFSLEFAPCAAAQLAWLEAQGGGCLRAFAQNHLTWQPLNARRHRLENLREDAATLAYRTWRLDFAVQGRIVLVTAIRSSYSPAELSAPEDQYHDKELHRRFLAQKFTDAPGDKG